MHVDPKVKQIFKKIYKNLANNQYQYEYKLITKYQGRGMSDKYCVAIEGDLKSILFNLTCEIYDYGHERNIDGIDMEEVIDVAYSFQQDTLGKSNILYWPMIEWTEQDGEIEEVKDE